MTRTRFAPSPNGKLHLGHAWSAIVAHDFARQTGGAFLLRIEDIDGARSRPEHIETILADLEWLGIEWDAEPVFQSQRLGHYSAAFERLQERGLVYPCFCSRSDIDAAPGEPRTAPDGSIVYPGTCRTLEEKHRAKRTATTPHSWRLDMDKVCNLTGPLDWQDREKGIIAANPRAFGDIVVVRKDAPASYHLAATLDDAEQGMTHIVRGMDLFEATHVHRLLQALLGLAVPEYIHHALLLGPDGNKLAKSKLSPSLEDMRHGGADGRELATRLRAGDLPRGVFLGPC